MKQNFLLLFMFLLVLSATAQEKMARNKPGKQKKSVDADDARTHEDFYLSLSLGPVFGQVQSKIPVKYATFANPQGKTIFSGTGAEFDLRMGTSISPHFILYGHIMSKAIVGPEIRPVGGSKPQRSDQVALYETMMGAGILHYWKPRNIFAAVSLGLGNFEIIDSRPNTAYGSIKSKYGPSVQLKLGKEWWVSDSWAIGISTGYSSTFVNNRVNNFTEQLSSNRFSISLNATFD